MSGDRTLLLFLRDGIEEPAGWMRLDGGGVAARGTGAVPPLEEDASERVIGIVPGQDVVFHWIDLPDDLPTAQAAAAARLALAEAAIAPVDTLHVAVGPVDEGQGRMIAVVAAARMQAWLGQMQLIGLDPDALLPETLLLRTGDAPRRLEHRDVHIVRGPGIALAAEPPVAAAIAAGEPVDQATFEAELADALAEAPLDLRQGPFARRRRWRIDWALVRRLAKIAGAILVVTLLIKLVLWLRTDLAADRAERQIAAVARPALPRATALDDPAAQLDARLAELRGGGLGFSATAAAVFAAVRDSGNVELTQMAFEPDGRMRLTASAANDADLDSFQLRLRMQGLAVEAQAARSGGGRQLADMTVGAP
jgi:general secretion pathway protein L